MILQLSLEIADLIIFLLFFLEQHLILLLQILHLLD